MKIALYYRHIDPADLPAFDHLVAELQRAGIQPVTIREGDSVSCPGGRSGGDVLGRLAVSLFRAEGLGGLFSDGSRSPLQSSCWRTGNNPLQALLPQPFHGPDAIRLL